MKSKEEKLALLEETAKAFTSETRCTDGDTCKYFMEGKQGCAIGRLIEDKELCIKLDDSNANTVSNEHIFSQLPTDLQEYGVSLLQSLQVLHDSRDYWNETGLSERGQHYFNGIKTMIESGEI